MLDPVIHPRLTQFKRDLLFGVEIPEGKGGFNVGIQTRALQMPNIDILANHVSTGIPAIAKLCR
jgi:hypothetical protein